MPILSRGRGGLLKGRPPSRGRNVIVLMGPRGDGGGPPPEEGLLSLSEEGEVQLTGDITFSAGSGITLTQVGQDIEISVT